MVRIIMRAKQESFIFSEKDEINIRDLAQRLDKLHQREDYSMQVDSTKKNREICTIRTNIKDNIDIFFVEKQDAELLEKLCLSLESYNEMIQIEREV